MATSPETPILAGRREAGRRLAERLAAIAPPSPVVVAMPRGGVPVAAAIAETLGAPLDIAVVRKIGAPHQPELAIGAIGEDGALVLDGEAARVLRLSEESIARVRETEGRELERRVALYREACPRLPLVGRDVILVDDGLATGATAAAAARSLRARGASRIVLAVPVCPAESLRRPPDPAIDQLVALIAPRHMHAVGYWYRDFPQVSDSEVLADLRRLRARDGESAAAGGHDAH